MDARRNPYSPGAGTQPPELAGRDDIIERGSVTLDRVRTGRPTRSFIFYGLRGVGKTVLLNRIRSEADAIGLVAIQIEAPEGRSLPSILVPGLRRALVRLHRGEAVRAALARASRALASFARAMKVKYADVELGLDVASEPGLADSGDLETDLGDLLDALGEAARARNTAVAIFIDELQYVPEDQLAALIAALHRSNQQGLPVTALAAGLPQLVGQLGRAKSYAERLFEFVPVGQLDAEAATEALCKPAAREAVSFEPKAVQRVLRETQGYPYFLQEWGKHCWNIAVASPIAAANARDATAAALAELDGSFFRVRFDRLTPAEKRYLRAMAELGPGPHRSGDIADQLGRKVTTVAPMRSTLINKGMIYSPAHGDTAFTVPLFDGFMKRTMPEL